MIFVTVGTHTQPFTRLIKKMDELAKEINELVIMQIGHSSYIPKNATYFRFTDEQTYEGLLKDARLVVGHAGLGTILRVLELRKPIIVIPRLRKFGEHMDDHQVEIATILADRGYLAVIYDVRDLEQAINKIRYPIINTCIIRRQELINVLKLYFCRIEQGN